MTTTTTLFVERRPKITGGQAIPTPGAVLPAVHEPVPPDQAMTSIGSPMLTWLKYQAALSGLRLMQPWLTLA
jgi:hypothetical protein